MKRLVFILAMSVAVLCSNAAIEVSSVVKNVISGDGSVRERVKLETKYLKFTSKRGNFVRYADHEAPEFKTSEALLGSAKIRQYMDMTTNKSTCFLMITIGREKLTEVVAYDDIVKIIDAVKTLKQQAAKDSIAGRTLKCYYVTDDGFQIGYNIKNKNEMDLWLDFRYKDCTDLKSERTNANVGSVECIVSESDIA